MKRCPVGLDAVADWSNRATAFHRAAQGKRQRPDVAAFEASLEPELAYLRRDILDETYQPGPMKAFLIRDPKMRLIHAPAFRDRVLHHVLMAVTGPVLDRALVSDTFACREDKGALAAVQRTRHHARRHAWICQIDIKSYFPSIDHAVLKGILVRKFRNKALLRLVERLIDSHVVFPGKGLPIGALTSQHFANYYLSAADRYLLEKAKVGGFVRYMDDLIWWGASRREVKSALSGVLGVIESELKLTVKDPIRLGRSKHGLNFCGYRIFPDLIRLSKRRKRRYRAMRKRLEENNSAGLISDPQLQSGYASVLATTLHADARNWRASQLLHSPLETGLLARYG